MRTVIFILAMSTHEIAVALDNSLLYGETTIAFMAIVFGICIIMDTVGFIRNKE